VLARDLGASVVFPLLAAGVLACSSRAPNPLAAQGYLTAAGAGSTPVSLGGGGGARNAGEGPLQPGVLPQPGEPSPVLNSKDAGGAGGTGGAAPAGNDAGAGPIDPLDVNLPVGVVSRFPVTGALGVCSDLPLRLSFGSDVVIGSAGSVRVFAQGAPQTPVAVIDVAAPSFSDTIAGRLTNLVRPVFLDGRDAVLYLRRGALQPNTQYFVTIDAGVFLDSAGAPLAALSDGSWTFTTGAAPAFTNPLVVDREGNGSFCTLQSALEAVPAGNTAPVTIELRRGTYHEIGYVTRKANITLHGEDRTTTVISYPNNDRLNAGTAARAMLTALDSDGFVVDNLTLFNTTPQGGSQAEALRVRGARAMLRNGTFKSLQDTLLLEGSVYVADSYIEGNVDFVWGVGAAFFERSEIKIVGRSGVIVQARNGANASGYVFVDSRLTSDPGITGSTLARIDATVYPSSQVAFIQCQMGPHIAAAGWTVTPTGTTATGGLRFWEFGSTDLAGQPLDVSDRHPASRQISAAEAAALRDPVQVLGWDPTP
jgi:pectin methylesterase-like acyl-CoA thioesterase